MVWAELHFEFVPTPKLKAKHKWASASDTQQLPQTFLNRAYGLLRGPFCTE